MLRCKPVTGAAHHAGALLDAGQSRLRKLAPSKIDRPALRAAINACTSFM